jgi:hypothetical protein
MDGSFESMNLYRYPYIFGYISTDIPNGYRDGRFTFWKLSAISHGYMTNLYLDLSIRKRFTISSY